MDRIELGETIELETGKEYICFARVAEGGEDYVFLMSNFKPLEIRFARELLRDGELLIEIVSDPALKQRLYERFQQGFGKKS